MSTSAPKARPLDIFEVLDRINNNDFQYYNRLNEEQQKSLQPYVLMKWMVGTKNMKQVVRINNHVNKYMFSLGTNHKELLFKLLCTTTDGLGSRYFWAKASKSKPSMPTCVKMVQEMWDMTAEQARESLVLLNDDTLLEMALYLGRQSDELTKLKAELKSRSKTTDS